jgi:hypothetical protein
VRRCAAAGVLLLGALSVVGCGCSGIASCVYQIAVQVTVRTAVPDPPLSGVVVEVGGSGVANPCPAASSTSALCQIPGGIGTYELEVRAPGFQPARRTVRVRGEEKECGCSIAFREDLVVVLVPN